MFESERFLKFIIPATSEAWRILSAWWTAPLARDGIESHMSRQILAVDEGEV